MADETRIPPAFRDALDEPAPPDPPEIEPERDDDGDGDIHIVYPLVLLLSSGAVQTAGLSGILILVWWHLSSFVTIALVIWAAVTWLPLGMTQIILTIALVLGWIFLGAVAEVERQRFAGWWKRRRAVKP